MIIKKVVKKTSKGIASFSLNTQLKNTINNIPSNLG